MDACTVSTLIMDKSAKLPPDRDRHQTGRDIRVALGIRRRNMIFAFWIATACAAIILIAFTIITGDVSSGWRLFVLDRVFKAVWAATMSVMIGVAALIILGALVPANRDGVSVGRMAFTVFRILVALVTAIATLGYFMPDWTSFSAAAAAIVILIWVLAGLTALGIRAA
ncbi:MAG: hypothetical protein ACREP6_09575 [Candidatus Binataceae bacterium]